MQPSSAALQEMMRAKTDEELYLILRVHSQDYTSETLKAASEEFGRRKLDDATTSRIMTAAEQELEGKIESTRPVQKPMSDAKETAAGWGCLILLCFVGYAIYGGYKWLDTMGWISHREDTVITAGNSWLVGESKECWSAPLNAEGAAQSGKPIGYAMSSVTCDDGPDHSMKVTFYGRKVQAEYKAVSWRCTRNEVSFFNDNSFTCYQTGGQR